MPEWNRNAHSTRANLDGGVEPTEEDRKVSAEWKRRLKKDLYLESLDKPDHATEYGGLNGSATINGIPGGADVKLPPGDRSRVLGLHMEPVPVMLRDAVTIETAVRLTGIARGTLAQAASRGNLPVLKTGPGPAPYLVRMRDLITYIVTMWTERRARKEMTEEDKYLGFPEWLVAEVSESWPDDRAFNPGHWQPTEVKVKRGGRPRSRGLIKPRRVRCLGRKPRKAKKRCLERAISPSHRHRSSWTKAPPRWRSPSG